MSEEKTAIFYISKRIDKLEENLEQRIDARFDSLEKTIDAHLVFCSDTRTKFRDRVGKLEAFKNKAVGVIALFMVLLSIWKVAG